MLPAGSAGGGAAAVVTGASEASVAVTAGFTSTVSMVVSVVEFWWTVVGDGEGESTMAEEGCSLPESFRYGKICMIELDLGRPSG